MKMSLHASVAEVVALFVFALANTVGCTTREDSAMKVAHEAARAGERACLDAGQTESCREPICRDQCDRFSDSAHLLATCIDKCMGRGT
jgi:hypothetical protein